MAAKHDIEMYLGYKYNLLLYIILLATTQVMRPQVAACRAASNSGVVNAANKFDSTMLLAIVPCIV